MQSLPKKNIVLFKEYQFKVKYYEIKILYFILKLNKNYKNNS